MAVVLYALASYVQNRLTEIVKEQVHMLLGVSTEIDKMDNKLRDLKNFLADADRRNIIDKSVKGWVTELRDVMYDATDIFDLCQLKAINRGPSQNMECFNPLLNCMRNPLVAHDISRCIKNLNRRLDSIKERSNAFSFINLGCYEDHSIKVTSSYSASRETSGELDKISLVGEKIEDDTRNLVELLTKEDKTSHEYKNIIVFAIVGVGGIGKTTLAQKVFNHNTIQQEFTKKIWLSVNHDFNDAELLRKAIIEAGGEQCAAGRTKATLERSLKEAVKGHKMFLVMDDLWNHRAWEDVLRTPLVNALAQGSRVLVTTRYDTVARGMKVKEPYHRVQKLEPEDAWSLLKKQVVINENDEPPVEMLKDIGMEIIQKCDCLPLAVKVMGGLLRLKTIRRADWVNILNDSIWLLSQMPEELNHAIYLSYNDLNPSLKTCFLHYSLLPKSTVFYVDDIIAMWISEGFIHENSCGLEELGREYYNELILRNLTEPDVRYTDQRVCSMHDIVRSFAQYVARDEALVSHNSQIGIIEKLNSQKFIRVSLESKGSKSNDLHWSSLRAQTSLRTLVSVGDIKIIHGDSLIAFSSLRILHMESAHISTLAESLYKLKHLRYLSIKYTNTSRLPEYIGNMKFLQYISVCGCKSLVKLPGSIAKLQQLRLLNLNNTSIDNIPRGFYCLTNIRKLYGFPAHMDGEWCSLQELGHLSQLTHLSISGLDNVSSSSFATKSRLSEKLRLSYLFLSSTNKHEDDSRLVTEEEGISEKEKQHIEEVYDELCPPPSLENLGIERYFGWRLPRWMMSTAVAPLQSLRILTMDDLACCTDLPDGLCQLPCLELLQIVRAPAIKRVGPEFLQLHHNRHCHSSFVAPAFPRLRKLNFNGMVKWEEWEWEDEVCAMPLLEELKVEGCKLRSLPSGLAFHGKALQKLWVYSVEVLSTLGNFASIVHLQVFQNPDLERISNLPKLQKLDIFRCPKIKILEDVPALQRLQLDVSDMEELPRYLQDAYPRHLHLDCNLLLLTSIAAGKSCPEWDKFSHIQQVRAYANDHENNVPTKWYVIYTREPFIFDTNISWSAHASGDAMEE